MICTLFAPGKGRAQSVVTATLTNNGSSTVNITSNQSFTLTLMINTNFVSSGITYFLQSNSAGSGLFTITAIDRTGSPYPISSDPPGPCGIACVLNPVNDFDLGATNDGVETDPPGLYTIATITLSSTNAPLGQYTIFIDRGVVTDRTGGGFEDRVLTALATINVVPEPTTVGLALLGGAALSVSAWRRRRTGA
jgi:hypothetical protein